MWRCKKCGGEVVESIIYIYNGTAVGKLDKEGCTKDIQLINYDCHDSEYECCECGKSGEVLEKIAKWSDD